MIGIFAQTREEVATLLENVEILSIKTIGNMTIYKVTYNNNNFYIIVTGVGKVNVTFAYTYALTKLCINKAIVAGNAASLVSETYPIGTVAIATNSLEWDVDFTALGAGEYVLPPNILGVYPTDPALQQNAIESSTGLGYTTNSGLFASGDTFVDTTTEASEINTETGALFLDNDTAFIGQLSYQLKIPYISVKGISNYANDTAVTDYNTNRTTANNLSNRVILEMLDTLFNEENVVLCNGCNTYNNTTIPIACPCNYRLLNTFSNRNNIFW